MRGVEDIYVALRFIKQSGRGWGGDTSQVTLVGWDSGACIVAYLAHLSDEGGKGSYLIIKLSSSMAVRNFRRVHARRGPVPQGNHLKRLDGHVHPGRAGDPACAGQHCDAGRLQFTVPENGKYALLSSALASLDTDEECRWRSSRSH